MGGTVIRNSTGSLPVRFTVVVPVPVKVPFAGGPLGCGVDACLMQDLPDRGGGDADPEGEQFAVDARVGCHFSNGAVTRADASKG
jgi:hypothetical protein